MPHRSRHRSDRRRAWLAIFAAIVVAGCRSSIPASDLPSATAWPEVTAASIDAASRAVSFETADGAVLGGRIFGQGPTAIVLSHMGDAENNQSDWYAFALQLSGRGFLALTFDRRGVCPGGIGGCSTGGQDPTDDAEDVRAATAYIRSAGATRVVAMGASYGAGLSLHEARDPEAGIDVVVWIAGALSSPRITQAEAADVKQPVLVIAAAGDPIGLFTDANILSSWLVSPKRLFLPESHLHGTDMLRPGADPRVAADVLDVVVSFLAEHPGP